MKNSRTLVLVICCLSGAGGATAPPGLPTASAVSSSSALAPALRPPNLPAGPAPSGVVITGTPLLARLNWNPAPNAVHYAVLRSYGSATAVEVTPPGFTATAFQDVVPDPRVTYLYSVVAYFLNGTAAAAPAVVFTSPPPVNPTGLTAVHQGQGTVLFQWRPVVGAAQYRLDGTGLPPSGYFFNEPVPRPPV